jgi:GNAT superfamily N-acetyltransferase
MDLEFDFREITYSDFRESFCKSWREAFGRDIHATVLDWAFGEASGNRLFVALDAATGSVAAGYCLLPEQARVGQARVSACLCNNVFTSPNYRRFNLFVRLGRYALEQVGKDVDLALGIPNAIAMPGHKRVGWKLCEPVPFYGKRPGATKGGKDLEIKEFGAELADEVALVSEKNCLGNGLTIVKTPEFFSWRYFAKPLFGRKYYIFGLFLRRELCGYVVLSHYFDRNFLHIIDICSTEREYFRPLLAWSENWASKIGVDYLNLWGSPALKSSLLEFGFEQAKESSNLIVKATRNTDLDFLEAASDHALVLGDNDVF